MSAQTDAATYQGFRVFVSNLSITKVKPGYTSILATVINTGREVIQLDPALSDKLIIKYDSSLEKILAQLDSTDVVAALLSSGFTLAPGNMKLNGTLKVIPTPTILTTTPTVYRDLDPSKEIKTEVIQDEVIAETVSTDNAVDKNTTDSAKPPKKKKSPKVRADKKVKKKNDAEEIAEVEIEKQTVIFADPEAIASEQPDPTEEQVATSEIAQPANEVITEVSEDTRVVKKKKRKEKSSAKEVVAVEKSTPEKKESVSSPNDILKEVADNSIDETLPEEGCADLILEELTVIKQNKNSVQLGYTIRNVGQGRVNLRANKKEEGIAIRGHLSSSDQLSRGALTVGGDFISVDADEATLSPGQSYSGTLRLPMYKLTKFTPYLIMQIDPYQKVLECDETNNLHYINLIPDSPLSKAVDHQ